MTNTIKTTALKPHLGPDGKFVQVGDPIEVDEHRHRQLLRKGYVPKPDGEDDGADQRRSAHTPGVLTNADFEPKRERIVEPPKTVPETEPEAPAAPAAKGRKPAGSKAQ